MEAEVTLDEVRTFETSRGNTRYVVRDTDGNELRAIPEKTAGPVVPASCGAEPEPQRHYAARYLSSS